MTLRSVFRALVLGEWIALAAGSFGVYDRYFRTDAGGDSFNFEPWMGILTFVSVVQTVAWVIASVGLWKFRWWARTLYVAVYASFILLGLISPLFVPKISSAAVEPFPTGPLGWLSGPIVGAIIALAWGSAVANEFRNPQVTGTRVPEPSAG